MTDTLQIYVLPSDQLDRVREAGGPLTDLPELSGLKEMSVVVAEVDGRIVAYWVLWYALHAEPLWIAEAYRKHPGVARGLVEQTVALAKSSGEPAAYAQIDAENLDAVGPYADRLGFAPAPGSMFYLLLQQPATTPEEG